MKRQRVPSPPERERTNSVRLGRLVGTFGFHGELKLDPSRSALDALAPDLEIEGEIAGVRRPLRVESVRAHKRQLLVRFENVEGAAAQALVGAELYGARDDVALAEGEYFDEDLVGCTLVDPTGALLGEVVDVVHYPAQDLLVVGKGRAFVPLVSAFVRRIDVAAKRIEVDLPEGLLEG